ncbi:hypothetical protein OR1_03330 [Geobacter sp. OR-1]|nr:hypothetical protein OR1_03330 [Geobacter sp. OR-1]
MPATTDQRILKRYWGILTPKERKLTQVYSRIKDHGFFMERYYRCKCGFFYASSLMNIRLLLFR